MLACVSDAQLFADIKDIERQEFEQLSGYLRQLDADGWIEQSYCSDWMVYQVVSHLASGSHIGKDRLDGWVNGAAAMTRDDMLAIWAKFDALSPDQMLGEYLKAAGEYLAAIRSIDDQAGAQEVEGFAGKRPLYVYQLARLWELTSHSWDVYVARDRHATFAAEAVRVLAPMLHTLFTPLDRERAAEFADKPVVFKMTDTGDSYSLDLTDRPRLKQGSAENVALVVEAPAEEICRFVSGRHFVPGSKPTLRAASGSAEDLAKLRRAFR